MIASQVGSELALGDPVCVAEITAAVAVAAAAVVGDTAEELVARIAGAYNGRGIIVGFEKAEKGQGRTAGAGQP